MSHPVGGVSSRTVIVSWLLVVCACPTARAGDDGPGEDEKPRAEKKEGRPAPDAARRESAGKGGGASSLELRLEALEEWKEDMELKSLQQEAEAESVSEEEDMVPEERTYIQAVRSLQAQNPEISVAGDLLFKLDMDEDFERFYLAQDDRSGLPIRSLDLHMQSSLDPFSLFKSAMTFEPGGGVWIEELYLIALDSHWRYGRRPLVHIFPTRLDDAGMSWLEKTYRHRPELVEFWRELRPGYLYFEHHHRPAPVRIGRDGTYHFQENNGDRPAK